MRSICSLALTLGALGALGACSTREPPPTARGSNAPRRAASESPLRDAAVARDGAPPRPAAPARVGPATSKVVQIVANERLACARRADGRVRCWGSRLDGKNRPARATPFELPNISNAIDLDLTFDPPAVYVVLGDGQITSVGLANDPRVPMTPAVPWGDMTSAIAVAVDGKRVFVVTRDHEVRVWGPAQEILGEPAAADPKRARWVNFERVPWLTGVTDLVREYPFAALHADGRVTTWRSDGRHDLVVGLDDATQLLGARCAKRRTGERACWDTAGRLDHTKTGPLLALAFGHSLGCELAPTGLTCVGSHEWDRLSFPVADATRLPRATSLPAPAIALAAGFSTMFALLDTGDVAAWGRNDGGQLGDGTLRDRATPAIIEGLTTPKPPPPRDGRDAVHEASVAMAWTDLPKGCTRPKALDSLRDRSFINVVSAYAYRWNARFDIMLADFQLDSTGFHFPVARGNQRVLELALAHGTHPTYYPIDRATYVYDGEPRTASAELRRGESRVSSEVNVDVTYLDKAWVCGTFVFVELDARDRWKPTGRPQAFAARIVTVAPD